MFMLNFSYFHNSNLGYTISPPMVYPDIPPNGNIPIDTILHFPPVPILSSYYFLQHFPLPNLSLIRRLECQALLDPLRMKNLNFEFPHLTENSQFPIGHFGLEPIRSPPKMRGLNSRQLIGY